MLKSLLLSLLLAINQDANLPNKVEGLELPSPIMVNPTDGFVTVEAKCKGTVKWLLISDNKVKYLENSKENTVVVGIPSSGDVNVFAIGLVDGKMTEFAVTKISVQKPKPKPVAPKKVEPPIQYTIKW